MFIITLQYSYRPRHYPVFKDTFLYSVSCSFFNNTQSFVGSRSQFSVTKTSTNAPLAFIASVRDLTFNESLYNQTIAASQSLSDVDRNISATFIVQDGNFTSSRGKIFTCDGRFFTKSQRGYADCVSDDLGLGGSNFTGNETQLKQQASDTIQQWPNSSQWTISPDVTAKSEAGLLQLSECAPQLFFELSTVVRPTTDKYVYPPDTNERRQWGLEYKLDSNGNYLVPFLNAKFVSIKCGFQVNATSLSYNTASLQKNGLIFFAILVSIRIANTIAHSALTIQTNTDVRIRSLSFTALALHMNSEYLEMLLFLTGIQLIDGLLNIQAFLAVFTLVGLFPMILRTVMIIMDRVNRNPREQMCKNLLKIVGMVFSTLGPAIIILVIAYFVELIVTFILIMLCTCYLIVTIITNFISYNENSGFPLYFVIINFIDKAVVLTYIFGVTNTYNFEINNGYVYTLMLALSVQLLLYLLQLALGPRFGIQKTVNQYEFIRPLTPYIAQQLDGSKEYAQNSCAIAFKAEDQENNISKAMCANPLHRHGRTSSPIDFQKLIHVQGLEYLRQIPENMYTSSNLNQVTNCFCYVSQAKLDDYVCPICFELLDIYHEESGMGRRIFTLYCKQLYNFETPFVLGDSQNVAITKCGHAFHEKCLKQWLSENIVCPACRGVAQ